MKTKLLKLTIALVLCLFSTSLAHGQEKLYVRQTDGSHTTFTLSEIRKLTFSENQLAVNYDNEASVTSFFNYDDITYINFKSGVGISENQLNEIVMYPNPVSNMLTVKSNATIQELCIYDLQGKSRLHMFPQNETVTVDLSHLPTSVYFVYLISDGKVGVCKIIKTL